MAPFRSYVTLLQKYLRKIRPNRILEWGPGGSTALMIQECPHAEIVSYEHDSEWFKVAVNKFSRDNVFIRHAVEQDYYAPKACGKFGVIFVDGRWRNECLVTSLSLLREGGVVILHDSERDQYRKAWKPIYSILEADDDKGTIVLVPKIGSQTYEE